MHFKPLFLLVFAIGASLTSCSDDNDLYFDRRDEENRVKIVIRSDAQSVPVLVNLSNPAYVKSYWEYEFTTKAYTSIITAQCEDEQVLIIGEMYINGKLRDKVQGKSYITFGVNQIKQDRKRY